MMSLIGQLLALPFAATQVPSSKTIGKSEWLEFVATILRVWPSRLRKSVPMGKFVKSVVSGRSVMVVAGEVHSYK
jgi:hypothetical protein